MGLRYHSHLLGEMQHKCCFTPVFCEAKISLRSSRPFLEAFDRLFLIRKRCIKIKSEAKFFGERIEFLTFLLLFYKLENLHSDLSQRVLLIKKTF